MKNLKKIQILSFSLFILFVFGLTTNKFSYNLKPKADYPTISSTEENNFSIIEGSEGDGEVKFFLTVTDVDNQFYDAALAQDNWTVNYRLIYSEEPEDSQEIYTDSVTFLPGEMFSDNEFIFRINITSRPNLLSEDGLFYIEALTLNNFFLSVDGNEIDDTIYIKTSDDGSGDTMIIVENNLWEYDVLYYFWNPHVFIPYKTDEENSFEIDNIDREENSITFYLRFLNDVPSLSKHSYPNNKSVYGDSVDVVFEDTETGEQFPKEAILISEQNNVDGWNYVNEYKVSNLNEGSYKFYAIINSFITLYSEDNFFNSTLTLEEDCGFPEQLLTFSVSNSPYIVDGGLTINQDSVTTNSAKFNLNVVDLLTSDFVDNITNNGMDIILKNSNGDEILTNARWLEDESDIENDNYTFIIEDLNIGTYYEIYSLEDTGLSIGSKYEAQDDSILVKEELNVIDNSFTTKIDNPYIVDNGFSIDQDSVTFNSVKFSLTVSNVENSDFEDDITDGLNLILKNESNEDISVMARWLSEESNTTDGIYTFIIEGLDSGTYYEIYSLEYTGLAVGSPTVLAKDSILVEEDLGVTDNSFTTIVDNPYIEEGDFMILEDETSYTRMRFVLRVSDNHNGDFNYDSRAYGWDATFKDEAGAETQFSVLYLSGLTDFDEGLFYFEIHGLKENTYYEFYSLDNSGLAIGGSTNEIDDTILIEDELGVTDNTFTTNAYTSPSENPYITNGSLIIDYNSVTNSSVEFSITVFDNENNDFTNLISNGLSIILKNNSGTEIPINASWLEEESNISSNNYTFLIEGLDSGTYYEIYSLENTGLAIGSTSNAVDDSILVQDELGVVNNSFTTSSNNPYILQGGLTIDEESITTSSVKFSLNVVDNQNFDFISNIINGINLILKDEDNNNLEITAKWLNEESSYENSTYAFKIEGLEDNSTYEIYSLENTGLAINSPTNEVDDSILVENELGVRDNAFKTQLESSGDSPYILDEGFSIDTDSITNTSFRFNLLINDPNGDFDNNSIDITLLKDSNGEEIFKKANLVGENNGEYAFEVNNLEFNTAYTVYSLDNTSLAVGDASNPFDDEILIEDDLNSNGSVTTDINPYLVYDSFQIIDDSIKKESVDFSIEVKNWDEGYQDNLVVILREENGEENLYRATLTDKDNDVYTYHITGLEKNKEYSFVSFTNPNFALNSGENAITDSIDISSSVSDQEMISFKTSSNEIYLFWFLVIADIIVILAIISLLVYQYNYKKKHKTSITII